MAWNDAPPTKEELSKINSTWDAKPPTAEELQAISSNSNPNLNFAPPKMPIAHQNLSLAQQLGGALEAGGSTMFGQQLGAGVEAAGDYVRNLGQGQSYNDFYQSRLKDRQDQLAAMPQQIKSAGEAGITVPQIALTAEIGGTNIPALAAGGYAQGASKEYSDILATPQTANDRAFNTGVSNATGNALFGVAGEALNSAANATKGVAQEYTPQVINGLKNFALKLGVKPTEIQDGVQGLLTGNPSSGNILARAKTLIDSGAVDGATNTEEARLGVKNFIKAAGTKIADIFKGETGQKVVDMPLASMNFPETLKQNFPGLDQEIEPLLTKNAPITTKMITNQVVGDQKVPVLSGTLEQFQTLKQRLHDVLDLEYSKEARNIPSAFHADDLQKLAAIRDNVAKVIEDNAPDEVAQLNKQMTAAYSFKPNLDAMLNKGKDVGQGRFMSGLTALSKNPVAQMAGTGLGGYVIGGKEGALIGASIPLAARTLSATPSIQSSMQDIIGNSGMIQRSSQSIVQLLANPQVQRLMSPAMLEMAQKYVNLSPDLKEKMTPKVLEALQNVGAPIEPPASGYQSEVNGKITSNNDRLLAGSELDKQKGNLGVLEWAKQKAALNKDGTIPPSLMPQQQPSAPAMDIPTAALPSQSPPPMPADDLAKGMLNRGQK